MLLVTQPAGEGEHTSSETGLHHAAACVGVFHLHVQPVRPSQASVQPLGWPPILQVDSKARFPEHARDAGRPHGSKGSDKGQYLHFGLDSPDVGLAVGVDRSADTLRPSLLVAVVLLHAQVAHAARCDATNVREAVMCGVQRTGTCKDVTLDLSRLAQAAVAASGRIHDRGGSVAAGKQTSVRQARKRSSRGGHSPRVERSAGNEAGENADAAATNARAAEISTERCIWEATRGLICCACETPLLLNSVVTSGI